MTNQPTIPNTEANELRRDREVTMTMTQARHQFDMMTGKLARAKVVTVTRYGSEAFSIIEPSLRRKTVHTLKAAADICHRGGLNNLADGLEELWKDWHGT
jgi:hypothetical protein